MLILLILPINLFGRRRLFKLGILYHNRRKSSAKIALTGLAVTWLCAILCRLECQLMKLVRFLSLLVALVGLSVTPATTLAQSSPPVLAFYYAWFDQNTWTSGQMADTPAQPYTSADRATIERQVAQAQSAGIDAFIQSWYGPQEANNQTETNFRTLLDVAQATGFKAAVDVEVTGPFFADAAAVSQALSTLLSTHVQHPAYFRYQGKPVIFFWRQNRFTVDEWAAIRQQIDPNHTTYWLAEGVEIDYQSVFDGHHLYSIAWAASPADQLTKWGDRIRAYAAEHQFERLWVATAMPGYDDTHLPRDNAFAVPRRNGDYYRETWRGATGSQPDMLIITSFNEWLEGTQLEPSAAYGNLYLDITRELVIALRGSPPSAPAGLAAAQAQAATPVATPTGPYVKVDNLTNVRRGPATTFDKIGELAAGSLVPVTGRTEAGDWWQIEFKVDPSGQGWVAGEVVNFVGDKTTVPVIEAPTVSQNLTVTPTISATVAPDNAPRVTIPAGGTNVRRGPGLNFDLLGRLDEDTTAMVVGKNEAGDWWQIQYPAGENGLAWVADAAVDFSGDARSVPVVREMGTDTSLPAATPTPTPPVIDGSIKVNDPINVRAEPSLNGNIVGGLYPGETADVLAVSEDRQWWQIAFADGPDGKGWVAAEFVQFEGDQATIPIFGLGLPTPTPALPLVADTPTPTPLRPTPTSMSLPTYAPTATSVYAATSAAALATRGTPDPALAELPASQSQSVSDWSALPWGILSALVVAGLLWYQVRRRRR